MTSVANRRNRTTQETFTKLILQRPAVLVTVLALGLYLSTLTAEYYWDGLAFAGQIERVARGDQGIDSLFHRNHLIYNPIVYVFYVIVRSLGLSVRALTIMQIISALSCAFGVAVFFQMARRISGSLYVASVGSALLAVSTCWWRSATDADAYSLSVALVLICLSAVLSETPRWYVAGATLAGAILVHELAFLSYPAAVTAVFLSNRIQNRLAFAIKLTLLALGVTFAAYYACAAVLFDIGLPLDVMKWTASNPYGVSFSNPIKQLPAFPKYQVDLIFGHSLKGFRRFGGATEWTFAVLGITAAFISIAVFRRRASIREIARSFWPERSDRDAEWRRVAALILVWVIPYVLFLLTWEPYFLHYRVYYLPPLVLWFVLALTNYHRKTGRTPSGAVALAVLALSFCNLAFFIGPHIRDSSNLLVVAAKQANSKWNEHTVIYFTDSSPVDGAFQYFNPETEWRGATPKAIMRLDDEIQRIDAEGGSVWLNDRAAKSVSPVWLSERAYGNVINVQLDTESYVYVQLSPARQSVLR